MSKIKIKYGIEDGYVGKDRPHYLTLDPGHFEGDMSDEDIEAAVWEMIEDDMREKISAHWSGYELSEIIAMVRDAYPAPRDLMSGEIG
jgi:hypothetical protein